MGPAVSALAISLAVHPAFHCLELDTTLATTADGPLCPVDSEVRRNNSPTVGEMFGQSRKQGWACPHLWKRGRYEPERSRRTQANWFSQAPQGRAGGEPLISRAPCFNLCHLKPQHQGSYDGLWCPPLKHHGYNHVHTMANYPVPYSGTGTPGYPRA